MNPSPYPAVCRYWSHWKAHLILRLIAPGRKQNRSNLAALHHARFDH